MDFGLASAVGFFGMNNNMLSSVSGRWRLVMAPLLGFSVLSAAVWLSWGQAPVSVAMQRLASGKVRLQRGAAAGEKWQFQASDDLQTWTPLATRQAAATGTAGVEHTDGGAVGRAKGFFRSVPMLATAPVGDHLQTSQGVVTIVPIIHGSFYLHWESPAGTRIIYSDPAPYLTLAASHYTTLPDADVILISHRHGDHWNATAVENLRKPGTVIIAPQDVYNNGGMTTVQKAQTTIFKTGQTVVTDNSAEISTTGLTVAGVPAYNANHVKGNCNSYVVTIGGKRIFISGDTGRTAEMDALTNIDVAFLCMNIPFTMTVTDAVATTRLFRPKAIYPYHFRNQDTTLANLALFETNVGTDVGVDVRLRTWY